MSISAVINVLEIHFGKFISENPADDGTEYYFYNTHSPLDKEPRKLILNSTESSVSIDGGDSDLELDFEDADNLDEILNENKDVVIDFLLNQVSNPKPIIKRSLELSDRMKMLMNHKSTISKSVRSGKSNSEILDVLVSMMSIYQLQGIDGVINKLENSNSLFEPTKVELLRVLESISNDRIKITPALSKQLAVNILKNSNRSRRS